MRLPQGRGDLSGKVGNFSSANGLKQAGRKWHWLLVNWLVEELQMEQCKDEPCVFRKKVGDEISLVVGVHVDDMIVSGEHDVCDQFFKQLRERPREKTERT